MLAESNPNAAAETVQQSTPAQDTATQATPEVSSEQSAAERYATLYGAQFKESVQGLTEEVQQLKQQITEVKQNPPPAPTQDLTAREKTTFVELLRNGDFEAAEELLATKAAKRMESKLTEQMEALQSKMSERQKIDKQIESFVSDLRRENPEIVPLEELITVKAQAKIQAAEGRIKSSEDFIREYKKAVQESVEDAKKLIQSYRGAGKEEAMTTKRTVLSASPISPNGVTSNGEASQVATSPDVSAESYVARRQQWKLAKQGLS